jgi:hypothetical protein
MARATSSFPVPDSPRIRILASEGAAEPLLEGAVLHHQRVFLDCLSNCLDYRRALERFFHEIVGAYLHRVHGRSHGAERGHQHHLDIRRYRLDRLEKLVSTHRRHHQVCEHHVDFPLSDQVKGLFAVQRGEHLQGFAGENLFKGEQVVLVVFDNENERLHIGHIDS